MKHVRNPLNWFIAALAFLYLRDFYFAFNGQAIPGNRPLESFFLYYPIACWVYFDSRKQKIYFPSDWVMLLMILFLPAYMYHTRRWKGLGFLFLLVLALCVLEWFRYQIVYAIRG